MKEFEVLERLSQAGVRFLIAIPDRNGVKIVEATVYDLILLLSDRESVYARYHRVSRDAFIAWFNDGFSVKCSHVSGQDVCEHIAIGGQRVTARTYLAMQGARCKEHADR